MATTSTTAIANMAILHCGISRTIADLSDTEDTAPEAIACRVFFEQARDRVLEAFDWPFARRAGPLQLVEAEPETSAADGSYQWGYSYRAPAAGAVFRGIRNPASRVTTADTAIKWLLASDASGGLVYTDAEDAYGVWSVRITDPAVWPAAFVDAVAYQLASYIALPLRTGADAAALADRAMALGRASLADAKLLSATQGVADVPPDSDFISVRN